MIFRKATEHDLPRLKEMEPIADQAAPPNLFWRSAAGIIGNMLPVDMIFVAVCDDGVVGMLGAVPVNADYWYVVYFYVDAAYRGRGVGRGLMKAAADFHAKEGRMRALATPVPSAMEAYVKMGYEPIAQTMEWNYSEVS